MPIETNPLDALVAFIFFVLLPFLQLRYPENPSPFHLHPKTIWLSILSFLLYCFFTFSSNLNFGIKVNHFQTLKRVFGSLSLLCLLVLLLPRHLGMLRFPYLHFMVHDLVHHSCAPRHQNSLHGSKGTTSIYEEGGASTLTNHFNGL
ncbi:hypothetical protein PHAVU_010G106800 [Phaseolus vulgaris]|uniref:Uncharacterized protein n=1 Tax=Phaseolus vulgaris TaxID=3885 RepID=V7APD8_PHAVU|nr:hypothetical protein PHAVU_010G106800g [Phaseolus vulgaris]ESW07160.1 hypothetical protein PHAVU_010G106800g [Phaseolus vulgaris]